MPHHQQLVKVNAPVDDGVVEVVALLNDIPFVYTTSSCEGRGDGMAYVWLRYSKGLSDTAAFFVLFSQALAIAQGTRVSATWGGGETLRIEVRIERRALADAAAAIREFTHRLHT